MTDARVRFPSEFAPSLCPVHSYNEILTPVAAERLWRCLIRAGSWETWYPHCKRLKFESGSGPDLTLGTRFSWTTMGVRVTTVVEEFEPPYRLAWRGIGAGSNGYHGWVIEPRAEGTLVVTEESQHGFVSSIGRLFLRRALLHVHQIWLERLAGEAARG